MRSTTIAALAHTLWPSAQTATMSVTLFSIEVESLVPRPSMLLIYNGGDYVNPGMKFSLIMSLCQDIMLVAFLGLTLVLSANINCDVIPEMLKKTPKPVSDNGTYYLLFENVNKNTNEPLMIP